MNFSEGQNNNIYDGVPDSAVKLIGFKDALSLLTKSQREKLIAGYDIKNLAKVFEDGGMMQTIAAFLQNGMNVSRTARKLYMHRNTLIYKLNSIRKLTGLDLRDYNMAVTFSILHTLYILK